MMLHGHAPQCLSACFAHYAHVKVNLQEDEDVAGFRRHVVVHTTIFRPRASAWLLCRVLTRLVYVFWFRTSMLELFSASPVRMYPQLIFFDGDYTPHMKSSVCLFRAVCYVLADCV